MAETAADILVENIIEWGVDTVFGLPGDGINGIMEALRTRKDKVQFIHVRHEEAAAFMACGYAKFTGRLGVCLATSGPGGLHLLNGLYDAKLDGQPVLAVTGHHFHDLIDTSAQQDVDLDRVFADVALYSTRVMGVAHVENVAHNACRIALSRRGVAHINFPVDFQSMTEKDRSERNLKGHADTAALGRRVALPAEEGLRRAAEVPRPGQARGVQLDLDPTRIGLRYPVEVGLVGDCKATLAALLPLLKKKRDRSFLKAAQDGMREWNALMHERATRTDKPMKPQVVA